jgi:hypothetical protein
MVETNTESYEYREVDLYHNQPEKHVEVIKQIAPLNDVDLEKYLTGYSFDMSDDFINFFYGVHFSEDDSPSFDKEKSEKNKELVKDRLEWLSSFEYTPKELKDVTKDFLEEFKGMEDSLNSFKSWWDIRDRWVDIVRSKDGAISKLRKGEDVVVKDSGEIVGLGNGGKYKSQVDYYYKKNKTLAEKNYKEGVRVR